MCHYYGYADQRRRASTTKHNLRRGINPHQAIIPPALLPESSSEGEPNDAFRIWVVGETAMAGAAGIRDFRLSQVPIINALLLERDQHAGRTRLLESVNFSDTTASFSRGITAIRNRLHAITGLSEKVPLIDVAGSGHWTEYRLHPSLKLDQPDEGRIRALLLSRVEVRSISVGAQKRNVAIFPDKGVREQVCTLLLREYGNRPLSAQGYTQIFAESISRQQNHESITQLAYPQINPETEARLFRNLENALVAFVNSEIVRSEDYLPILEQGVLAYQQLVFHCHYIASAVACKFSHRMPFEDLYQEAMQLAARIVKRHEYRAGGSELKSNVVTSVDRHIRRLIVEQQSGALRIGHTALESFYSLQEKTDALASELQHTPTMAEVAEKTGLTPERIAELRLIGQMVHAKSVDTALNELGSSTIYELVAPSAATLYGRWLNHKQTRTVLESVITNAPLTDLEKLVLSVQYDVHFKELAGLGNKISSDKFIYPYNAEYFPLPKHGVFNDRIVADLLGVKANDIADIRHEACAKARQFLEITYGMRGADLANTRAEAAII